MTMEDELYINISIYTTLVQPSILMAALGRVLNPQKRSCWRNPAGDIGFLGGARRCAEKEAKSRLL